MERSSCWTLAIVLTSKTPRRDISSQRWSTVVPSIERAEPRHLLHMKPGTSVSLSLIPLHFFVSMLRNFHGKLNSTLLLFYKHHMDIYQNFWSYPILFLGALLLFCPCLHVAPYFPDWFWIFLISQLRYQDFQLLSQIINVNKFPRISCAKFFRQCFQSYNKN